MIFIVEFIAIYRWDTLLWKERTLSNLIVEKRKFTKNAKWNLRKFETENWFSFIMSYVFTSLLYHELGVTQGQFLSGVPQVWIQSFPSREFS